MFVLRDSGGPRPGGAAVPRGILAGLTVAITLSLFANPATDAQSVHATEFDVRIWQRTADPA